MADKKQDEVTDETPQALTGGGGRKLKVRAKVTYGDLAAGDIGIIDDTADAHLDVQNKYIEIIDE